MHQAAVWKMVVLVVVLKNKKASQLWVSSDYSDKQRLQYLIYLDWILYNKEKTPFELQE
jgi:hypothetical protein